MHLSDYVKARPQSEVITAPVLLLFAFATIFFPRIINSIGAPSPINFVHFLVVPIVLLWILVKTRPRDRHQASVAKQFLSWLYLLLIVVIASALLNKSSIVNSALSFFLLAEPPLFLIGLLSSIFSYKDFLIFRTWFVRFSIFHLALSLIQAFLLTVGIMKPGELGVIQDNIQGVFYVSGGGHNVAASVSMAFGIYYLGSTQGNSGSNMVSRLRIIVLILSIVQLLYADSKQTMLAALIAWTFLTITKAKKIVTFLKYTILITVIIFAMLWAIDHIPLFRAFGIWLKPDIYGRDGVATQLKVSAFPVIISHYESILNWFLGLGPGHTVSRTGGWIIREYWSLLGPLGATVHPASGEVWNEVASVWIGRRSSMFSPLFGWAGIWGDLGFLGLGSYIAILVFIWKKLCKDDFSKFILLTMAVHGFIFSQMEEPGFMVHSMTLIFLRWKELKLEKGGNQLWQ
ncbi:MAG: hypothetical protein KME14_00305 [Tildeniella torsiva UHER 1998/13D]|jgi:hypothetical protein|nr:hypothetical protein [Tildeniella torsiva UHER 1998/13D]